MRAPAAFVAALVACGCADAQTVISAGRISPGGSNGAIQYNSSGAFGGLSATNAGGAFSVVETDTNGNFVSLGTPAANITAITSAASPYSVTATDALVLVDATTAVVSVKLPSPGLYRRVTIKDAKGQAATHNITVNRNLSDTIDGATSVVLSTAYAKLTVQSDGTNYYVVGN